MTAPHRLPAVPAIGYLRVSKEEQARGDRTSLPHQRARLAQLADALGLTLAQVFEDPGISGGTAEDRPGFQALLRYCAAHPQPRRTPGLVLVYNDSRWGRFADPEEATYWRVHLSKHAGWTVRFTEGDDTADPLARGILRSLYSSQASAYRDQIRQNATQGARGTAAQGYWQTEAPLGYRREATSATGTTRVLAPGQRKADDERVRLTPGPADEVALVQWLFTRYAAGGESLGSLATAAATRFPGRAWGRQSLATLLRNPAYVGDVVWCRRPHDAHERREGGLRDPSTWVVRPDAHPPLIDRALFAAVDARLAANRARERRPKVDYPLSGLIRCAHCGQPYVGAGGPRGPAGDPDRYRCYRDRGMHPAYGGCAIAPCTLVRRVIEPLVLEAIGEVVRDPGLETRMRAAFRALLAQAQDAAPVRRQDRARERQELLREQERLVGAIGRGLLTDLEAGPRLQQVRAALADLTQATQAARFTDHRLGALEAEVDQMVALARDFPGLARRLQGAELRALVRPWIEDAVMDRSTRTFTLTLRAVPALGFLALSGPPGPAGQHHEPIIRHFSLARHTWSPDRARRRA